MTIQPTLLRLQSTLKLNQRELAALLRVSPRTIIRYYQRGGVLAPSDYERLAVRVHPHDAAFAAELAAVVGKSLVDLGLAAPAPEERGPSTKHLLDSVVCAAAEAMQVSPHLVRPALVAALERALALGMTADEVLSGLAPEPAAKSA